MSRFWNGSEEAEMFERWGLFGVGGNLWESTLKDASISDFSAWRGACWSGYRPEFLRCERRDVIYPVRRDIRSGFRLVLAPVAEE